MPLVYLKLTNAQRSNLQKGKGARMTPSAQGSGDLYGVDMNAADYKRYSKALLSGKGCIVKGSIASEESESEEVEGGKINWKKVGRQIKKGANTVGVDTIEGIKKYIPEEVAKNAVQYGVGSAVLGATTFAGMPNPQLAMAAGKAAGVGVDAGYKTDFRKRNGLKQFGKNYIEGAQQEAMATSMSGGRINMKKVGRRAKKFANTVGKDGLEFVKKYVPKEELQEAVKRNAQAAVLRATDNAELADRVGRYGDRVVDAGYNTDFNQKNAVRNVGRQLKDVKQEIINDSVDYALNQAVNGGLLFDDRAGALNKINDINQARKKHLVKGEAYQGVVTDSEGRPVSRKKFVKGSPEAKAYMQMLRDKRKTKGSGLVKSHVNKIEQKIGMGMVPLGRGMVPLGGRGMVQLGGGMVPL
jgi:hypothetical protein